MRNRRFLILIIGLLLFSSCQKINSNKNAMVNVEYDLSLHFDSSHKSPNDTKFVSPSFDIINNRPYSSYFLHAPANISYGNIQIGDKPKLSFDYGIREQAWKNSGDGVRFVVQIEDIQHNKTKIYEDYINPKNKNRIEDRKWKHADVDLSSYEIRNATLHFSTLPGENDDSQNMDSDWSVIANPKIVSDGIAVKHSTHKKANVILITIDTLRADYLGCYGNDWIQTPNIDSLSSKGITFEHSFSTTSTTSPSHSSIFTSLMPNSHGVIGNDVYLANKLPTLTQILKEDGYKTGAAVSVVHLKKSHSGLANYFDRYYEPSANNSENLATLTRCGYSTVSAGIEMLDSYHNDPFFIWLHLYDPHVPYVALGDFHQMYYDKDPMTIVNPSLKNAFFPHLIDNTYWMKGILDLDYFKKEYGAEISYADRQIGRLMKALERLHLDENTLIVLTGDHGENLGEHEIYFDHWGLHNTDLHVPLIVYYPKHVPQNKRISTDVSGIDIAPTILELTDLDDNYLAQQVFQGKSLVSTWSNKSDGDLVNRILSANALYYLQVASWNKRYKAIWEVRNATYSEKVHLKKDRVSVFDRIEDPNEIKPVAVFSWFDRGDLPEDYSERVAQIQQLDKSERFFPKLELVREVAGNKPVPTVADIQKRFGSRDDYTIDPQLKSDSAFFETLVQLLTEIKYRVDPPPSSEFMKNIYDIANMGHLELNSMPITDPEFKEQLKQLGYTGGSTN